MLTAAQECIFTCPGSRTTCFQIACCVGSRACIHLGQRGDPVLDFVRFIWRGVINRTTFHLLRLKSVVTFDRPDCLTGPRAHCIVRPPPSPPCQERDLSFYKAGAAFATRRGGSNDERLHTARSFRQLTATFATAQTDASYQKPRGVHAYTIVGVRRLSTGSHTDADATMYIHPNVSRRRGGEPAMESMDACSATPQGAGGGGVMALQGGGLGWGFPHPPACPWWFVKLPQCKNTGVCCKPFTDPNGQALPQALLSLVRPHPYRVPNSGVLNEIFLYGEALDKGNPSSRRPTFRVRSK